MKKLTRFTLIIALLLIAAALAWPRQSVQAQDADESADIIGIIYDNQDIPVRNAHVTWKNTPDGVVLLETSTQADGLFALILTENITLQDEHRRRR